MAEQQNWITLDSVIYDYINQAELSQNKYFKLYHLAVEGMDDMGLDFFYHIKSVQIPISANKTFNLPSDYLQYTKLGVLNAAGEVVPLKYNDNLTGLAATNPNRITDTTTTNFTDFYSVSSPVFFNYWNGTSYYNLYGVGYSGLYGGGFKIDGNVIIVDSIYGWDNLVMEYTASPEPGKEQYIPLEFRRAMIQWLAWKDIEFLPTTRRGAISNIQVRRHEYFEARRLAIRKYRPFYLDQAYLAHLEKQRLVVKS